MKVSAIIRRKTDRMLNQIHIFPQVISSNYVQLFHASTDQADIEKSQFKPSIPPGLHQSLAISIQQLSLTSI